MAKTNKLQEKKGRDSYLNLIVGVIVVVAIAAVIVGIVRGRMATNVPKTQDAEVDQAAENQLNLPAKHTVAAGEDLWKISEKYYKTGYNWTDIAEANNLSNNPNALEAGTELTIPNISPRVTEQPTQTEPTKAPEATPTQQPSASPAPTHAMEPTPASEAAKPSAPPTSEGSISGSTYTVVKGDFLWDIAVRAYGDGYKWVEIARANKLINPDVIHVGNQLTLPR